MLVKDYFQKPSRVAKEFVCNRNRLQNRWVVFDSVFSEEVSGELLERPRFEDKTPLCGRVVVVVVVVVVLFIIDMIILKTNYNICID